MAEENTAEELEEDAAGASDDNDADAAENDIPSGTEEDTTDGLDGETGSDQGDGAAADSPSEPANEPTIGNEVPIDEPPVITSGSGDQPIADISMILDIPVTLSMEIGQTRISINELLKLSKDSVIELQRMADEPLDVLVNGTLVAHGEAVVVGDRFGIRLTDVISPQERLRKFT
jgi:flagellar motor switch protein FliN/FliY